MKKIIFLFFYLMSISIAFYSINHKFMKKGASVYAQQPEELYGCTIQVHNHLGESLEGVSFRLYGYYDSKISLSYLDHVYNPNIKIDATYMESTTKRNGILHFYGLEEGRYYLEETDVPSGYQVLKERIMIKVDKDSTDAGIDYYIVNGGAK